MSIGKKYNIDEEKITNLVKDGVIGWGEVHKDEIISCYQNKIESGIPKTEAIKLASDEKNIDPSYLYKLLKKMKLDNSGQRK